VIDPNDQELAAMRRVTSFMIGKTDIVKIERRCVCSAVFEYLFGRVWTRKILSFKTKWTTCYATMVLPILLYGCESWHCKAKHLKTLESFQLTKLRTILGME